MNSLALNMIQSIKSVITVTPNADDCTEKYHMFSE